MPIKKKKISELKEAGDLKGFYTIGYRLLGGVKESVKIGLEYIQTAYEKVVQATKDAIAATTDMRQLEATVEGNEEARETAENRRSAAEQSRQTAESERLEKENERNVSEELRVSAETQRGAAEEERRTAEGDRVAAEQIRDAAETERKVAEAGRVTAEQARATEYAGIKTESEDVIAAHRSAVASANQAAIYANREGDTAKEKASLADAAAQAANTAATTIDDKMQTAINKLIAGAPDALDTLNELAAALGNDPNFATTIATELGKKLNKTDIINDVVTGGVDKVLSAQQGVELAGQIVEMGKNAGGKMVLIPSAVLNLTNASTSNEILDAFGSKEAFIDIVTKVKEGAPAAIDIDGGFIILPVCRGDINEVENSYILIFFCIDPSSAGENYSFSISLDGDVATIQKYVTPISYANIVNIPGDATRLTLNSTSDEIIAAFGGMDNFNNIVKRALLGNAIVLTSFTNNEAGSSISAVITNSAVLPYTDENNFVFIYDILTGTGNTQYQIVLENGIASLRITGKQALVSSDLVSDPSTGGTDIPASAEAVKVVNNKVVVIQGKIDDGSLKGEKGDTGPQGPKGDKGDTSYAANSANYTNQLQAFTEDNFTGGNHFMKAIRDSSGWSTRLWMCYENGAKQSTAISVGYADSCGNADTLDGNHAGSFYTHDGVNTGWFRSSGAQGWYSNTYGGGIYMTDTTYVRTYNNKAMAAAGGFWKESDRRLKSHITPLRHTLDQILAIPTAGFVMDGKQQIGTIAQEVEKICPEVVSESLELKSQVPEGDDWEVFVENDHKGNPQEYVKVKRVEYEMLGVLALEGVKLLAKEVEELRNRLNELER